MTGGIAARTMRRVRRGNSLVGVPMHVPADVETSFLACPACGRELRLHPVGDGDAIARCACDEFPLAEGVLVTSRGPVREHLLDALRRGDARAARGYVLGNHRRKARLLESVGMRLTFERFVRHRALGAIVNRLHLRTLLEKLPPRALFARIAAAAQWNGYARHRFVQSPMLATIALLGLARQRSDGLILDAPCGMGHLAFLLGKLVGERRLVCMDCSAPFVYATRRFFAPGAAAAIVHDMNGALPLASASVAAVFCSDSFHYVENRRGLAREFMRVIRDDGVVVLTHVHNRLHRTPYSGYPLTPSGYADLFDGFCVRIVPEPMLIDAYLSNAAVDLSAPVDERELHRSPYLALVAAKSNASLGVVAPVRDELLDRAANPRVNRLYRVRRSGDAVMFERRLPEPLEDGQDGLDAAMPRRISIPASSVGRDNGRLLLDRARERELLERHVLIDVPEDF